MSAVLKNLRPGCHLNFLALCLRRAYTMPTQYFLMTFVVLETLAASRGLVGAKADIRKCFDSASPQAALLVWKHLGAPPGVLHVLNQFYDKQCRWYAMRDCSAAQLVMAAPSLLQGCPASSALLNALLTVWIGSSNIKSLFG